MNSGHTVFRQLLQYLPRHEFKVCVSRYRGECWSKSFCTFGQFLCLAYAQMAGRESLRDIQTCLNSHNEKLYHIGFRGDVSRTTHSVVNERRIATAVGLGTTTIKADYTGKSVTTTLYIASKRNSIMTWSIVNNTGFSPIYKNFIDRSSTPPFIIYSM